LRCSPERLSVRVREGPRSESETRSLVPRLLSHSSSPSLLSIVPVSPALRRPCRLLSLQRVLSLSRPRRPSQSESRVAERKRSSGRSRVDVRSEGWTAGQQGDARTDLLYSARVSPAELLPDRPSLRPPALGQARSASLVVRHGGVRVQVRQLVGRVEGEDRCGCRWVAERGERRVERASERGGGGRCGEIEEKTAGEVGESEGRKCGRRGERLMKMVSRVVSRVRCSVRPREGGGDAH